MGKKVQLEKRYSKWGYIFVLPFFVLFMVFHFWPLASTIYYSFCYLKHAGNTNPEWIKENISIFDFKLDEEDMKTMRSLNQEKRFYNMSLEQLEKFVFARQIRK